MASLILFTSCEQYENDTLTTSPENSIAKFSGEDLFKGLFFFQNDISKNISYLNNVKLEIEKLKNERNKISTSLKELSDISINYINEKYPDFFDELQQTMYSGNLYDIEKGLNKSVKLIEQAILSSNKFSKSFIVGQKIYNKPELKDKMYNVGMNIYNILTFHLNMG